MRVGVVAYGVALVALCACDGVWLTIMLPTYRYGLGDLLAATPQLVPAVVFYLLYAAGVIALVVRPGGSPLHRWSQVAGRGALLGLVAYGTYDLTNQATLRDWPAWLTALDMAWGTVLTAIAATLAHAAARATRRSTL
jgi:uncharacterized membrane protein